MKFKILNFVFNQKELFSLYICIVKPLSTQQICISYVPVRVGTLVITQVRGKAKDKG